MTQYGKLAAKIYDPLLGKPLDGIRRRVLLEAKRTGARNIVDLCCGTGHQLKYLTADGSFDRVVGVDLSPNMLEVAKGYGVECHLGDATKTSFNDGEFDLSMVSFALHEKPFDLARKIVEEARRITRPGGYFFVVDYVYDEKTRPRGKFATWFIEFLVGGEHYRNFKQYHKLGGLPELTRELRPVKDIRFVSGAVALQIFRI